ncbi:ADP-forming succinate--CoA ligase subunit beta [Blattabacterium sp. (Blaberus giganteus)]|uniref:ADP-forming succinate--CoA ligase subunit beta n=1 Tax=Blattabacterium sp. (Blaberus giganteus) TaxID=1186051 RepID=UPI00025F6E28|nr:ADP-forming succinate--CoA ligase subunit beta [Blattabacterium sp. (Blaberus giganteus)]AFJ90506.1 succinyl-CoA ligase (ADP-forming) subunit beta [Blattabacterium sp. (Blaberus giganteus)]
MNLYEYQGREILKSFSIQVPDGMLAYSPEDAVRVAKILFKKTKKKSLVIKAQIHAGGRGKAGGIQIAKNLDEVYEKSKNILGKFLITPQTSKKGKLVKKILLSEDVYFSELSPPTEYYLSILLNRDIEKNMILYSREGGVNIEDISKKNPNQVYTEVIDPILGLQFFQTRKIGFNLGIYSNDFLKNFSFFLFSLYKSYINYDALLLEINPLIKTFDEKIVPVDVKIILDDNALFRHKKYNLIRDKDNDINTIEKEAIEAKLNFLKLKGNVGCMVNGAGLAMATMDMIKSCGGVPANFLDIGGSADQKRVETAFDLILKDKSVKTIFINIFGGIVRCDTVAEGIINSYSKINQNIEIPVVVRLQGTNEKIAKKLIKKSLLPIYSTDSLKEASYKIQEILHIK